MNKRGFVCIGAGLLLLLAAAGLTGYNIVDERRAGENAERAYELLSLQALKPGELDLPEDIVPAHEVNPEVEMRVIEIDGHYYNGFISIPSIELS